MFIAGPVARNNATAIGKVLLAHAPADVRERILGAPLLRRAPRTITNAEVLRAQIGSVLEKAIAFEHEESAIGIVCVAAPVFDAHDTVVAAVSVTGPVTRFHPASHASAVRAAAAGIAATIARRDTLHPAVPLTGTKPWSRSANSVTVKP